MYFRRNLDTFRWATFFRDTVYMLKNLLTFFSLSLSELSLVGLALDVVD